MSQTLTLINAVDGNGAQAGQKTELGGKFALFATATAWGGATLKLEVLAPSGAWLPVVAAGWTADTFATLDLPDGTYRGNVTGGAANTGHRLQLRQIEFRG